MIELTSSNIPIGLGIISEFVVIYALPGKPIVNMMFKVYGPMAMNQGLTRTFAQNLKLGQYMHIPPRMLVSVQVLAGVCGALVKVGVLFWVNATEMQLMINRLSIISLAFVQQMQFRTLSALWQLATTFFTASVVWNTVGPQSESL
jgi:hypothetical protein